MFDKDRLPDVVPREIRCSVFEDRLHALREAYDGVDEDVRILHRVTGLVLNERLCFDAPSEPAREAMLPKSTLLNGSLC